MKSENSIDNNGRGGPLKSRSPGDSKSWLGLGLLGNDAVGRLPYSISGTKLGIMVRISVTEATASVYIDPNA